MLVDTHCHLDLEDFNDDLDFVIARAREAGLLSLQTICTSIDEAEALYQLTERDFPIFCSVGTHPLNISTSTFYNAEEIASKCARPKIIGIGETGLDYHYDTQHRDLQLRSFSEHIIASQETGLPLIIHTRDADEDTMKILEYHKKQKEFRAVFHCFTSSQELAMWGLEMGFYISASGIITFKNAQDLREIFKKVPLDRLLVETDSPYLAPVPLRGRRNEPSFVTYIAEFLAELRGESYDDFCRATTKNFFDLFSKAKIGSA